MNTEETQVVCCTFRCCAPGCSEMLATNVVVGHAEAALGVHGWTPFAFDEQGNFKAFCKAHRPPLFSRNVPVDPEQACLVCADCGAVIINNTEDDAETFLRSRGWVIHTVQLQQCLCPTCNAEVLDRFKEK